MCESKQSPAGAASGAAGPFSTSMFQAVFSALATISLIAA